VPALQSTKRHADSRDHCTPNSGAETTYRKGTKTMTTLSPGLHRDRRQASRCSNSVVFP
jgi:hypothetical protein